MQTFSNSSSNVKHSEFQITYPILHSHTYKVTIEAAMATGSSHNPSIYPQLFWQKPANLDDGGWPGYSGYYPADGSATPQVVNSNTFADYVFTVKANSNRTVVQITAFAESVYAIDDQNVYVKKISIEDITVPVFTITPTSVNASCGGNTTQTFQLVNVNNIQQLSMEYFELLNNNYNGWVYNGAQAPDVITGNTVTLTTKTCDKGGWIRGVVNYNGTLYYTPAAQVNVLFPSYGISGPSTVTSASAGIFNLYNSALIDPPPPLTFPCNSGPIWSISNNLGTLYPISSTSMSVYKNPGTLGGASILTAKMPMCGTNVVANKTINFPTFGFISNVFSFDSKEIEISPNPASSFVKITLNSPNVNVTRAEIFSMDGRIMHTQDINSAAVEMNISSLPTGTYIVRIAIDGVMRYKKIVKN